MLLYVVTSVCLFVFQSRYMQAHHLPGQCMLGYYPALSDIILKYEASGSSQSVSLKTGNNQKDQGPRCKCERERS